MALRLKSNASGVVRDFLLETLLNSTKLGGKYDSATDHASNL